MASSGQLSGVTAGQGSPSTTPQSRVPAYTTEEKQWLKKNHQDEFHFLRMYSYSIYDEEERAEGRLLVRAFMNDENEGHSQGEQLNGQHNNGDEDSDDATSFQRELDEIPESHFADHYFNAEELEFIRKHYSYSSNFLYSYGLKFYDDEDCKEGKAILRQLMIDD